MFRSASPTALALSLLMASRAMAAEATGESTIPTRNLLEVIVEGGWLMFPIGLCSFILCIFVLERIVFLRRGSVIPRPFVRRFLDQLRDGEFDQAEALERCEDNGSAIAQVFAAAIRRWGKPSVEVEQAVIDTEERVMHSLRRYLRLLNGISTITPLLGLLGTVLGMIRAFNAIVVAGAMGRPELLASGISQALITTAAGLTVAIPALVAYLFFIGRVDRLMMEIDGLAQQVVAIVASDGWSDSNDSAKRSRKKRAA